MASTITKNYTSDLQASRIIKNCHHCGSAAQEKPTVAEGTNFYHLLQLCSKPEERIIILSRFHTCTPKPLRIFPSCPYRKVLINCIKKINK